MNIRNGRFYSKEIPTEEVAQPRKRKKEKQVQHIPIMDEQEQGLVEIGQDGGGENFNVTLDKISNLRNNGLNKLTIHLEDAVAKRGAVTEALVTRLSRASFSIDLKFHVGRISSLGTDIKLWIFQDCVDTLLTLMMDNPRLVVRSLNFRGSVSPTHEVLLAFVRAKRHNLRELRMFDFDSDAIDGETFLCEQKLFSFCVSSAFLPKLLRVADETPGLLTLRNVREVPLSLLRYFLTQGASIQQLEGDCNMADIIEVSRRSTSTRKLLLKRGTLKVNPSSPVLTWYNMPNPVSDYFDLSELVLHGTRIHGNLDSFFGICANYVKLKMISCSLEDNNNNNAERVHIFPKLPCPELTFDMTEEACWSLFHKVLESQVVLNLTVILPDVNEDDLDFARFCRNLTTSNIRTLNVAFNVTFTTTTPLFLASVAEMKYLENLHVAQAVPHPGISFERLRVRPIARSHSKYLLEAAKRHHKLRWLNVSFFDDNEGEDSSSIIAELEHHLVLNHVGVHSFLTASEDTMPHALWSDVLARAACSDTPDALFSILRNKFSQVGAYDRYAQTDKAPKKDSGKFHAWETPRRYGDCYVSLILFRSAAFKATAPVMFLFLITLLQSYR